MDGQFFHSETDVNDARANIFSALSDSTRLRIFQTLIESDESVCVNELCERTELQPNLVSHHLKCLKNCQLVTVRKDGRKRYYEVSRPEAIEMLSLADECIRQNVESVLNCDIAVTDNAGDA